MEKNDWNLIESGEDADFISEDMVFQILSWLPVMSLLRFKSACKSWYALLHSHSFISHHLRRHQPLLNTTATHDHDVLIFTDDTLFQFQSGTFELYKQTNLPYPKVPNMNLFIITSNGLVCAQIYHDPFGDFNFVWDYLLWNPATKESRFLPRPPLRGDGEYFNTGFGFDSQTDDYYVVLFTLDEDRSTQVVHSHVYKYSLLADSWTTKRRVIPENNIVYTDSNPRTQVRDGSYCWFASSDYHELEDIKDYWILSFEFSKDVFGTIPLPDTLDIKRGFPEFFIINGCIACINRLDWLLGTEQPQQFEIWMLCEYGIEDSWTKLYTVGPFASKGFIHTHALLKNKEYQLFSGYNDDEFQLWIYNIFTHEIKKLPIYEGHQGIVLYKESLVSINGGTLSPKG